jgi:hypothetical protein
VPWSTITVPTESGDWITDFKTLNISIDESTTSSGGDCDDLHFDAGSATAAIYGEDWIVGISRDLTPPMEDLVSEEAFWMTDLDDEGQLFGGLLICETCLTGISYQFHMAGWAQSLDDLEYQSVESTDFSADDLWFYLISPWAHTFWG